MRMSDTDVELSVVVPVYGCASCVAELHRRLRASLESIAASFELIFVDDRSPDGAWETLREIAAHDSAVKAYRLSRNFGQHAAITAGLAQSSGRWVVVMDCDLEEPPELIPRLYEEAQGGFEIVQTSRTSRKHPIGRRLASRLYRYLTLETQSPADHGTMSMVSRKVVNALLSLRDKDREYLLMLDWLGFDRTSIEFEHQSRTEGRSSYDMRRLFGVAMSGVAFRTTVLLRWVVTLGFVIALGGFGLAVYDIYVYATGDTPSGYTSLAVLLLLLTGFIIVSLGVVGLYVGRIFEQVKGRPLFVIDEHTGEAPRHSVATGSGALTAAATEQPDEVIEESVV